MMDYLIEPSSAEEGGRVADGCSFTRYFKTSVKLPYKSQFNAPCSHNSVGEDIILTSSNFDL